MSGEDLAVLVNAVAISSAQYLTLNDLNILVAVFTQLADTYATISVIRSFQKDDVPSQQQEETVIALETT